MWCYSGCYEEEAELVQREGHHRAPEQHPRTRRPLPLRQVHRHGEGVTIQKRQAVEFGSTVTLYRATTDDGRQGTLWHRDRDKAVAHFQRLAPIKGWA